MSLSTQAAVELANSNGRGEGDEDPEAAEDPGIVYVREAVLSVLASKVMNGDVISREEVHELFKVDDIPDEEVMLAVTNDLHALGFGYGEGVEQVLDGLEPNQAAEAMVRARDVFEENPYSEVSRITFKEWRRVFEHIVDDNWGEAEIEHEEEFPSEIQDMPTDMPEEVLQPKVEARLKDTAANNKTAGNAMPKSRANRYSVSGVVAAQARGIAPSHAPVSGGCYTIDQDPHAKDGIKEGWRVVAAMDIEVGGVIGVVSNMPGTVMGHTCPQDSQTVLVMFDRRADRKTGSINVSPAELIIAEEQVKELDKENVAKEAIARKKAEKQEAYERMKAINAANSARRKSQTDGLSASPSMVSLDSENLSRGKQEAASMKRKSLSEITKMQLPPDPSVRDAQRQARERIQQRNAAKKAAQPPQAPPKSRRSVTQTSVQKEDVPAKEVPVLVSEPQISAPGVPHIRLATPNGQELCAGLYIPVENKQANGMPVWKQQKGEHFLYSGSNGHWLIGGPDVEECDFDCYSGWIESVKHDGSLMPNELAGQWKRWTGEKWQDDDDIVFTRHQPVTTGPKLTQSNLRPNIGVVVRMDFKSDGKSPLQLKAGQVGKVMEVSREGHARIHFEGQRPGPHYSQWVTKMHFNKLQIKDLGPQTIAPKPQKRNSGFTPFSVTETADSQAKTDSSMGERGTVGDMADSVTSGDPADAAAGAQGTFMTPMAFDTLLLDLGRRHPTLLKEIAEAAANSMRFQFLQECARSCGIAGEVPGAKARRVELWESLGEEERRDLVEAYNLSEGDRDTFFLKIVEEDRMLRQKLDTESKDGFEDLAKRTTERLSPRPPASTGASSDRFQEPPSAGADSIDLIADPESQEVDGFDDLAKRSSERSASRLAPAPPAAPPRSTKSFFPPPRSAPAKPAAPVAQADALDLSVPMPRSAEATDPARLHSPRATAPVAPSNQADSGRKDIESTTQDEDSDPTILLEWLKDIAKIPPRSLEETFQKCAEQHIFTTEDLMLLNDEELRSMFSIGIAKRIGMAALHSPAPNNNLGPIRYPHPGERYDAGMSTYVFQERLGKGAFHELWVTKRGEESCVIKRVVALGVKDASILMQEALCMARSQHPNLVSVMHERLFLEDLNMGRLAVNIVMQYCNAGNLKERIVDGLDIPDILAITKSVAMALEYMHYAGLAHCDVKPTHILFCTIEDEDGDETGDVVKLGGFQSATALGGQYSTQDAGTLLYMPPDAFEGTVSAASDIWALGRVAIEMLVRTYAKGIIRSSSEISELLETIPEDCPEAFQELICCMLAYSKSERPSAEEVVIQIEEVESQLEELQELEVEEDENQREADEFGEEFEEELLAAEEWEEELGEEPEAEVIQDAISEGPELATVEESREYRYVDRRVDEPELAGRGMPALGPAVDVSFEDTCFDEVDASPCSAKLAPAGPPRNLLSLQRQHYQRQQRIEETS